MRQQVLILLAFTALAILPGLVLTFIPWFLFDSPLVAWVFSNLVLVLIPIGYGYVIYRRNYLQLDIFMSKTLTLFLMVVLLTAAYSVLVYALRNNDLLQRAGLPTGLLLMPFLLLVPYAGRPTRRAVEGVLYGRHASYQDSLAQLTTLLSTSPQHSTLETAFQQILDVLQIRQGAMLIVDERARLVDAVLVRVGPVGPIAAETIARIADTTQLVCPWKEICAAIPNLGEHGWIANVVFLQTQEAVVGLLLFGRPVPDGYLTGQDSAFLRQLADTMAIAVLNIRLFESMRMMSRQMLQVRDQERVKLAAQLHDEPLQRITLVASSLRQRADKADEDTQGLNEQSDLLRDVARQLREICAGLHSPVLQQGLQWAVRDAIYHFRRESRLVVHEQIDMATDVIISDPIARATYHILIESLNNIRKHAQATTVAIGLFSQEENLCLVVEDDGVGSSIASLSLPDLVRRQHFGLADMHEWANMINGELVFSRRDGGGTRVSLTVPPPWRRA